MIKPSRISSSFILLPLFTFFLFPEEVSEITEVTEVPPQKIKEETKQAVVDTRLKPEKETAPLITSVGGYRLTPPIVTKEHPIDKFVYGIGGKIKEKWKSDLSTLTLGEIKQQRQQKKYEEIISGFESLTPEEALKKVESKEKGYSATKTFTTTPTGTIEETIIAFNPSAYSTEIKQAGNFKGLTKKQLIKSGTAEIVLSAGKVGIGFFETGQRYLSYAGMKSGKQEEYTTSFDKDKYFQTGIYKKAKDIPETVVGKATRYTIYGAFIAPMVWQGGKFVASSIKTGGIVGGVGKTVSATAYTLSPYKPSPNIFLPQAIGTVYQKGIQPRDITYSVSEPSPAKQPAQIYSFGKSKGGLIDETTFVSRQGYELVYGKLKPVTVIDIARTPSVASEKTFPATFRWGKGELYTFKEAKNVKNLVDFKNTVLGYERTSQFKSGGTLYTTFKFVSGKDMLIQTGRSKVTYTRTPVQGQVSGKGIYIQPIRTSGETTQGVGTWFIGTTKPTKPFGISSTITTATQTIKPTQSITSGLSSNIANIALRTGTAPITKQQTMAQAFVIGTSAFRQTKPSQELQVDLSTRQKYKRTISPVIIRQQEQIKPSQDIITTSKYSTATKQTYVPVTVSTTTTTQKELEKPYFPSLPPRPTSFTPREPPKKRDIPIITSSLWLPKAPSVGFMTSRKVGGSRKFTKYTPSFSAMFYKIRGKKRKLGIYETGFSFRPIPISSKKFKTSSGKRRKR